METEKVPSAVSRLSWRPLQVFRFRNTSFISRAIRLTEEMRRPRAADISDASAPRFANLANRCLSASVHSFGLAVCLMDFIEWPQSAGPSPRATD